MHHVHMSTPFFFVTVFGFIGLVAIIFAFVRSMRNDRLEAEAAIERAKLDAAYRAANPVRPTAYEIQQVHGERLTARQSVNGTPFAAAPAHGQGYVPNTYAPVAPVYAHDPLTGLATGMLIGSALSHHNDHTTIIERDHYVDSTPSHSSSSYSSSSSDSGFSYSDSSSSSASYDSGSSGGFDSSW
jgi:hypothetical protein